MINEWLGIKTGNRKLNNRAVRSCEEPTCERGAGADVVHGGKTAECRESGCADRGGGACGGECGLSAGVVYGAVFLPDGRSSVVRGSGADSGADERGLGGGGEEAWCGRG